MRTKIRLFIWLSSLLAAVLLFLIGLLLPWLLEILQIETTPGQTSSFPERMIADWPRALQILGGLVALSSSLLYFAGKNLKTPVYYGIFVLLMVMCVVAGALIAIF